MEKFRNIVKRVDQWEVDRPALVSGGLVLAVLLLGIYQPISCVSQWNFISGADGFTSGRLGIHTPIQARGKNLGTSLLRVLAGFSHRRGLGMLMSSDWPHNGIEASFDGDPSDQAVPGIGWLL